MTAFIYFNTAAAMWDGIGISDMANPKLENEESLRYATYKLVLLLYTEKILGQLLSFHEDAEYIIWHLQNSINYGIHTDYDVNLDPSGSDENVETTSLVIGLNKWPEVFSKSTISSISEVSNNLAVIVIVSALVTSVGIYLLQKSRKWR